MVEIISIRDDVCWMCGKEFDNGEHFRTMHHTLPQHLQPVKNITLPICKKCHDRINYQDISALTAFSYRISKEVEETKTKLGYLCKSLEEIKNMEAKWTQAVKK